MVISQFPAAFGKYILLDRINAGGMAEVFRAKVTGAERFERLVAIKCMLPALLSDEHFITMFIDEAKLAAQLSHANIVQIYELGRLGERLYIAMELISGRDVRHILRAAKAAQMPLQPGFAAYVVSKVAAGLDFAHRKVGVDGVPLQLVHRDVSPQNILVSYDGEVKVVDFGIAKAEARATETQAGVLKGKFAYMAPEQVTGSPTDRRADIFALGSVLYEVVTGQRLFTGDNDLAVLEKVRAAKLPNLRDLLPKGSEELEHVLVRALARRPEDRYAHASEMAEDLEHLLIEERSIFGSKRAAQVMQGLYAQEVAQMAEQLRLYAQVNRQSCVVSFGEEEEAPDETLLYEGFAPPAGGAGGEAEPVSGRTQLAPPPPPPAAAPPRRSELRQLAQLAHSDPATGAHTRVAPPTAAAPRAGSRRQFSVDGHTDVDRAPTPGPAGRVVRRLTVGALVASLLAATLVIGTFVSEYRRHPERGGKIGPLPTLPGILPTAPARLYENNPVPAPEPAAAADDDEGDVDARGHSRWGYLQVKSISPERARVFIDGKDVGQLPLAPRKVRVGSHEIRVVEEGSGRVRQAPGAITVGPRHTRRSPKQVAL